MFEKFKILRTKSNHIFMQLKDQYQLVILGYFICLGISIDIRRLVANTKFKIKIEISWMLNNFDFNQKGFLFK